MERLDCPCMDECINKMCCVCVYTQTMEHYLAMRKKKIQPIMKIHMNREDTMLSKITQTQKDKYHMISPICRI